jgi:hypothetical protein
MTEAQLIAELALPAYAGMTANEKVALLNAPKAGVTFPVIVPKATVMAIFTTAMFRIAATAEPGKTAWLQIMANIRSLDVGINPSDGPVQAMLAQGVADGVITAEEKQTLESLGLRPGSRAEELWGEGTTVSLNDVARVS